MQLRKIGSFMEAQLLQICWALIYTESLLQSKKVRKTNTLDGFSLETLESKTQGSLHSILMFFFLASNMNIRNHTKFLLLNSFFMKHKVN